ncbi:MAG: glycerate kinase [Euzebyaceae bacterium]|nr:glycerate kinase [Euzebyaceae bacterium]
MKVVVAPDKFAGTLTGAQAAAAMRDGWLRARPGDEVVAVPMADGGEGTIEVVAVAVAGSRRQTVEVADARGRAVEAQWLRLPDGRALVESAQACGLSRLSPTERDPKRTTTYGVGQLLADVARHGVGEVVVGLGGSATVDGGAGMAIALGHRLLRADGNGVKVGGEHVATLRRVLPAAPLGPRVVAAADVANPLLGAEGAVATFAAQKGATERDLPILEAALSAMADAIERDVPGGPWRDLPRAGAAGGLGFALAALLGARLVPGAAAIADLVGLDVALDGAGVVVTGEGSLDAQTGRGKVPAYVAERARSAGALVYACAGRVVGDAGDAFDAVTDLGPDGLVRAAELVSERTERLARQVGDG